MGEKKIIKRYMKKENICLITCLFVLWLLGGIQVWAYQWAWENENIANTKHNLSPNGPQGRTVVTSVNEICVFCHTPHAAAGDGPIWNRSFSQASYTMYKGTQKDTNWKGSFDARMIGTTQANPTGYSKLCLSCHDGSIAITKVLNATGSGAGSGPIGGSSIFMPTGAGEFTGDTRRLGTDLSNDHPVSFRMTQAVRQADKELFKPDDCAANNFHYGCNEPNWKRKDGVRLYPLDFGGNVNENAVQCTSCHNPHNTNTKFLRGSLYNLYPGDTIPPAETANKRSQICEACHVKPGWVKSTHEYPTNSPAYALFTYRSAPSEAPELDGNTVAQHGCVNCHDPHTMQGADRLHRNGAGKPGDTYGPNANDSGKTPAIENTCYQCHIDTAQDIPNLSNVKNFLNGPAPFLAPDIKSVFDKNSNTTFDEMVANGSSMPLDRSWAATNPGDTNGIHQPVFVSQDTMQNRQDIHNGGPNVEEKVLNKPVNDSFIHVECVDCHNPHQVNRFNRLKGMKGITINGDIIGGDSGTAATDSRQSYDGQNLGGSPGIEPLVYEICFRCHGDSYNYNMPYRAKGTDAAIPGPLRYPERNRGHLTTTNCGSGECAERQFGASNKKKEFNPASSHWLGGVYSAPYNTSYHPVNAPGRNGSVALYNQLAKAFKLWEVNPSTFTPSDTSCDTVSRSAGSPYLDYSVSADAACAAAVLSRLTIQCTDCHNNSDLSNTNLNMDSPVGPIGPITGLPDGTSYRRPTDRPAASLSSAYGGTLPYDIDPSKAQGPHGSVNPRILRAPYRTNLGSAGGSTIGTTQAIYNNFGLCFQCHEKAVFLAEVGGVKGSNFGKMSFTNDSNTWSNSLHRYHLTFTGAYCHECHNNVHSNVESNNTIYGDGNGNYLPPDSDDGMTDGYIDTHLINFGPQEIGNSNAVPTWYYKSTYGRYRCNLQCHGINMSACWYNHSGAGSSGTGVHDTPGWSCGDAGFP